MNPPVLEKHNLLLPGRRVSNLDTPRPALAAANLLAIRPYLDESRPGLLRFQGKILVLGSHQSLTRGKPSLVRPWAGKRRRAHKSGNVGRVANPGAPLQRVLQQRLGCVYSLLATHGFALGMRLVVRGS